MAEEGSLAVTFRFGGKRDIGILRDHSAIPFTWYACDIGTVNCLCRIGQPAGRFLLDYSPVRWYIKRR